MRAIIKDVGASRTRNRKHNKRIPRSYRTNDLAKLRMVHSEITCFLLNGKERPVGVACIRLCFRFCDSDLFLLFRCASRFMCRRVAQV